ncbi:MAG: energy transducer TonB [Acidobacteriia bacterium]|nr:energy transducer TonB [Terriglobia bacterium]
MKNLQTLGVLAMLLAINPVGGSRIRGMSDPALSLGQQTESLNPKRVQVDQAFLERNLLFEHIPTFPMQNQLVRIEGEVVVHVVVSTGGRVIDARLENGDPRLALRALEAAKSYRYYPHGH